MRASLCERGRPKNWPLGPKPWRRRRCAATIPARSYIASMSPTQNSSPPLCRRTSGSGSMNGRVQIVALEVGQAANRRVICEENNPGPVWPLRLMRLRRGNSKRCSWATRNSVSRISNVSPRLTMPCTCPAWGAAIMPLEGLEIRWKANRKQLFGAGSLRGKLLFLLG